MRWQLRSVFRVPRSAWLPGLLAFGVSGSAVAQVGHNPSSSPYRDITNGKSITVFYSDVGGDGGKVGVGPHHGTAWGARFDVRLSAPLQFALGFERARLERFVVSADDSVATRKTGPFDQDLTMIEATMQLNLTGNNTHTGLTTINTGNVLIGGSGTPLGTTAGGTVVNSGGSVLHNVSATVAEPITINGTGVGGNGALRTTGARTWSGAITVGSSGALIAAGNNTFTITGAISDGAGGANNYDLNLGGGGNIRLNTGTFNIGNGIINKEGAGNIQTEAGITAGGTDGPRAGGGVAGGGGGSAASHCARWLRAVAFCSASSTSDSMNWR